jgi:hypothetical protein
MLIYASARDCAARVLPVDAHIVLAVGAREGSIGIQAFMHGEFDASYAGLAEARLPTEILRLLAELRDQITSKGEDAHV